jgi:hypothetical protein
MSDFIGYVTTALLGVLVFLLTYMLVTVMLPITAADYLKDPSKYNVQIEVTYRDSIPTDTTYTITRK